ncbi:hypothetical protein QUC31_019805 [Theobroma cacao]
MLTGPCMVLLSGVVLLESKAASAVIEIKEWRRHYYRHTIELQTYAHKKIGARMFHNRAVERSRPSLLRIFVKTDIVLIQRHLSQAQVQSSDIIGLQTPNPTDIPNTNVVISSLHGGEYYEEIKVLEGSFLSGTVGTMLH